MTLAILTICAVLGPLDTSWWAEDSAASVSNGLMTSLAAYWELEETGNRADSHNDYDLIELNGSSTRFDDPKIGTYCVKFTGDGEALSRTNTIFDSTNDWPFTINFWYKRDGADTANQYICGVWDSNNTDSSSWHILVDPAPRVLFNVMDTGLDTVIWSNSATLGAGYTMVTVTWEPATTNATVYINASGESDRMEPMFEHYQTPFTMGSDMAGQFSFGSCLVDSVAFWTNRALSASDVTNLYNGGSGKAYPFE